MGSGPLLFHLNPSNAANDRRLWQSFVAHQATDHTPQVRNWVCLSLESLPTFLLFPGVISQERRMEFRSERSGLWMHIETGSVLFPFQPDLWFRGYRWFRSCLPQATNFIRR